MSALPKPSDSTGDYMLPDPGVYKVVFYDFEGPIDSTRFPGSQSVILKFRIIDDDEYEGIEVKQYYGWSMHKTKAQLYPVVKTLAGRDIDDDENFLLEDLINTEVNATISHGSRPDKKDPTKTFTYAQIDSIAPLRARRRPAPVADPAPPRAARAVDPEFDESAVDSQERWPESA